MGNRGINRYRHCVILLWGLSMALSSQSAVWAAGVSYQVHAEPGDIVVFRTVPARPGARSMPPGKALMINPKPNGEITQGLGAVELSNAGYAGIVAGQGQGGGHGVGGLSERVVSDGLSSLSGGTSAVGGVPAGSLGGAVGAATGGIGKSVTGALAGSGLFGAGSRP